jgi:hypothetical protein
LKIRSRFACDAWARMYDPRTHGEKKQACRRIHARNLIIYAKAWDRRQRGVVIDTRTQTHHSSSFFFNSSIDIDSFSKTPITPATRHVGYMGFAKLCNLQLLRPRYRAVHYLLYDECHMELNLIMLQCNAHLPCSRGIRVMANATGLLPILQERRLESLKRYRYHAHYTVSCCTQNEKSQAPKMQLKVRNNVTDRPRGQIWGTGKKMR